MDDKEIFHLGFDTEVQVLLDYTTSQSMTKLPSVSLTFDIERNEDLVNAADIYSYQVAGSLNSWLMIKLDPS